ncbi:MAG TPA: hypothetical protein PLF40_25910, partial [Kofleriaceae bacterium]|nr:hypothetical protein [Kofleriaceae bacterium]
MTNTTEPPKPERGQLRIVCAAVMLDDGTILLGPRHWDARMHAAFELSGKTNTDNTIEGFIDQHGTFFDREESLLIALAAGQRIFR